MITPEPVEDPHEVDASIDTTAGCTAEATSTTWPTSPSSPSDGVTRRTFELVSDEVDSAVNRPISPPTTPTARASTASIASARGATRRPKSTSRTPSAGPAPLGRAWASDRAGAPTEASASGSRHGSGSGAGPGAAGRAESAGPTGRPPSGAVAGPKACSWTGSGCGIWEVNGASRSAPEAKDPRTPAGRAKASSPGRAGPVARSCGPDGAGPSPVGSCGSTRSPSRGSFDDGQRPVCTLGAVLLRTTGSAPSPPAAAPRPGRVAAGACGRGRLVLRD